MTDASIDPYAPAEVAHRVENVGVAKAKLGFLQILMLGLLTCAFIALGGAFFTLVMAGNELGFWPGRTAK